MAVEKIIFIGSENNFLSPRMKKTSRSTHAFVDYEFIEDSQDAVELLTDNGYQLIGLEISSNSIDLSKLSLAANAKVCLILGSEKNGISDSLLSRCETVVHIPMKGKNSSMNVASACAIAVYEITKQLSA